jgi:hypothetical protein
MKDAYPQPGNRMKGAYPNRLSVREDVARRCVLRAIQEHMLSPDRIAQFRKRLLPAQTCLGFAALQRFSGFAAPNAPAHVGRDPTDSRRAWHICATVEDRRSAAG